MKNTLHAVFITLKVSNVSTYYDHRRGARVPDELPLESGIICCDQWTNRGQWCIRRHERLLVPCRGLMETFHSSLRVSPSMPGRKYPICITIVLRTHINTGWIVYKLVCMQNAAGHASIRVFSAAGQYRIDFQTTNMPIPMDPKGSTPASQRA